MSTGSRAASSHTALLVACLLVAGLVGFVAMPALAGDNAAIFFFEEDEIDVDSGDTITVDVVLRTYGGYGGEGIATVAFAVEYDSDILTATDLERGPWLEGDESDGDGTTIDSTTEIDDDAGRAWIEQTRDPYGDGATGEETVATVTFEVSEEAEPTTTTLAIVDRNVTLVNEHPQTTMDREGTVVIDGGGEQEPSNEDDDPDGVTLADDGDDSNGTDEPSADETETDDTDSVSGFGVLVTLSGLVATLRLVIGSRRR